MAPGDYTSVGSGKLKLKGVKDSKVDKKKKKKSKPKDENEESGGAGNDNFKDKSVILKKLEEEDRQIAEGRTHEESPELMGNREGDDGRASKKTDAERRYEEQRRRRLEERLMREGVKTHKERVEELNRYLSGLSEHHDMPRIGPG